MGARIAISFPIVTCFVHFLVKNYKKVDIYVNLGYIYKHKRDSRIGCEYGGNYPKTQRVSGFRAACAETSRLGQCLQGFVGFLPRIFAKKKPRAVRVWFWVYGATARLGAKQGLFTRAFPFEGN